MAEDHTSSQSNGPKADNDHTRAPTSPPTPLSEASQPEPKELPNNTPDELTATRTEPTSAREKPSADAESTSSINTLFPPGVQEAGQAEGEKTLNASSSMPEARISEPTHGPNTQERPKPSHAPGKPRRVALQTAPLGSVSKEPELSSAKAREEQTSPTAPDTVSSSHSNPMPSSSMRSNESKQGDDAPERMEEDEPEKFEKEPDSVSRKRPRSPTPDDDDVDATPTTLPRPTIRLQVDIHPGSLSKSDYIASIPKLSVEQLESKYPKWAAWYRSTYLETEMAHSSYQSVGLSQQELEDLGDLAKLLQKYPPQSSGGPQRKRRMDEYDVGSYDTKDPFVDDSELGLDEPTHIVKTRSDGFYVAQGPVELARAKSNQLASRSASAFRSSINGSGMGGGWSGYARQTNKLLAKRAASRKSQSTAPPVPKAKTPQEESMPTDQATPAPQSEPDKDTSVVPPTPQEPSQPREATPTQPNSGSSADKADKKKSKYPTRPVHPQLQAMFDHLKTLVQRASFAVKTKFPPELKPPLIDTAKLAVELDEYNDNFFNYLPSIFPYNRFTMMVRLFLVGR